MINYVCPKTKVPLTSQPEGLRRQDGRLYPYLDGGSIPVFTEGAKEEGFYSTPEFYRNSLNWLLQTFGLDEQALRSELIGKLSPAAGERILITGCGLGGELASILEAVGPTGAVHAQDLSAAMVKHAASQFSNSYATSAGVITFSVSDALELPFEDGYFDRAFHFGGINEFPDVGAGIRELNRVVKVSGRIVFGDEGVAPWLKGTEYAAVVIRNNALWASEAPLHLLPSSARNAALTWILGNCFYIISFERGDGLPKINLDVPHIGVRGGSLRTRYYGQLEGVVPETKAALVSAAKNKGVSIHTYIENALRRALAEE